MKQTEKYKINSKVLRNPSKDYMEESSDVPEGFVFVSPEEMMEIILNSLKESKCNKLDKNNIFENVFRVNL
ncbi:hypothetical protein [Aliarcobacter butzleri]|uniref:hypothetical protein n=1 Tax=Aliarcobacter butzleri TaxID=28197 RepID=UPI003AD1F4D0